MVGAVRHGVTTVLGVCVLIDEPRFRGEKRPNLGVSRLYIISSLCHRNKGGLFPRDFRLKSECLEHQMRVTVTNPLILS